MRKSEWIKPYEPASRTTAKPEFQQTLLPRAQDPEGSMKGLSGGIQGQQQRRDLVHGWHLNSPEAAAAMCAKRKQRAINNVFEIAARKQKQNEYKEARAHESLIWQN